MLFDKSRDPLDVLREAVETYRPDFVFSLLSGGNDSNVAAHVASQIPEFTGCVHVNTGIGLAESLDHVRRIADRHRYPLWEFEANENPKYKHVQTYDEVVRQYGFPGPAQHGAMYIKLKERALRHVRRRFGQQSRIMYVSGARRHESKRRMSTAEYFTDRGNEVWVNPILDFDGSTKHGYLRDQKLIASPVAEILCMSGECLCGAMADPDGPAEKRTIKRYFPVMGARIDRLAKVCHRSGLPCQWGEKPPEDKAAKWPPMPNQLELFTPLCHSCNTLGG